MFFSKRKKYPLFFALAFIFTGVILFFYKYNTCSFNSLDLNNPPSQKLDLKCSFKVNTSLNTKASNYQTKTSLSPANFPSSRNTVPCILASTESAPENCTVIRPIAHDKWLVEAPPHAALNNTNLTEISPRMKIRPSGRTGAALQSNFSNTNSVALVVCFLSSNDKSKVSQTIISSGGEMLENAIIPKHSVVAKLPACSIPSIANLGEVRLIEDYNHPNIHLDLSVAPNVANISPVWNLHGFTGNNQIIATVDTGIDTGEIPTLHADLKDSVLIITNMNEFSSADYVGHGTHTAGILAGNGSLSSGLYKGIAHGAKLIVQTCGVGFNAKTIVFRNNTSWNDILITHDIDDKYEISIHSDSWGSENSGSYYDLNSEAVDSIAYNNKYFLPVFAAGNSGSAPGTISSPATAKNVITVGNSYGSRMGDSYIGKIVNSSSRGPCSDGRIKPDIVTAGYQIISTRTSLLPSSSETPVYYAKMTGTSMSTPAVAGAAAITREWLINHRGFTNTPPTAAIIKAVLLGGARDHFGSDDSNTTNACPNVDAGWGWLDLEETLFPSNRAVKIYDDFKVSNERIFSVTTTNSAPLDIQLVWIDPPATSSSSSSDPVLIINHDLIVSNRETSAVWYGNDIYSSGKADNVNNCESVRIPNAPAGNYDIIVKGSSSISISTDYNKYSYSSVPAIYARGAFPDETTSIEKKTLTAVRLFLVDYSETSYQGYQHTLEQSGDKYGNSIVVMPTAPVVTNFLNLPYMLGYISLDNYLEVDETGQIKNFNSPFSIRMDSDHVYKEVYFLHSLDSNSNGIPDWYEYRYFAYELFNDISIDPSADLDNDGHTLLQELTAGTNPKDTNSKLEIISFSLTNITWRGGDVRTQYVETATSPTSSEWTAIFTNIPPVKTENSLQIEYNNEPQSFYRIRAL